MRHELRTSDRLTKTKVINLRPQPGLAINTKPKCKVKIILLETMQIRPNDTYNYMESVHKSPRVDTKHSTISRNAVKHDYTIPRV